MINLQLCRALYHYLWWALGSFWDIGKPCEGDEECPVCFAEHFANKGRETKCGHRFCKDCLLQWRKISGECPVCRQDL